MSRQHELDASREMELRSLMRRNRKSLNFFEEKNRQLLSSYSHTSWKPATGWFDFAIESITVALMIASVIVYFLYMLQMGQEASIFRSKYSVYDADSSAPSRYHLLQRSRSNATDPALYPGQPGSWALPSNAMGLEGVTSMLVQASNLGYLWSTYNVIVSAIILLLMFNLIRLFGFQPRLSVIPASLHLMSQDLFHLLIIFISMSLPLSILVVILVGPISERASTFNNAFVGVFTMFVTGAGMEGSTRDFNLALAQQLPVMTSIVVYASLFVIIFVIVWVLRSGIALVIIM